MTGTLQDLRYAIRGLARARGFAAVAVLTLALGIGANTAMFSVLNTVLLKPLPYPSPEQLAMVWTERPSQGLRVGRSTYADVEEWRARGTSFVDMAVYDPVSVRLMAAGELGQASSVRTSPNLFSILGVQPLRGRIFSNDEAEERRRVVVLSHRFWQLRFGGADTALGATVELDGVPSQVIGILPPDFTFAGSGEVWEPHTMFPDWNIRRTDRGGSSWFVLGRLRPGATVEKAQEEMNGIARGLDERRPAAEEGRGVSVQPLSLHIVGPAARFVLWMLMGAVFCVFLIAVTNITNLSLARSAGRGRAMALRLALGASQGRIFRQLIIESVALGMVSGLVGLLVAVLGTPLILAFKPAGPVSIDRIALDARVLGWTLAVSLLSGILVGLAPALTARGGHLRSALHDGGKGSSAGTSARLTRGALVVAEFALAIVLLVGAGLLIRSMANVQRVDTGFNSERVLSIQLALPDFPSSAQRTAYYRQVLDEVESVGGVEEAGVIGDLFIDASSEQVVTVEGATRGIPERVRLRRDEVSDRLFATLRVPLRRGRWFSPEDGPDSSRVAIVNDTMARRLWPGQDAIGRRFKLGALASDGPWFTVVGVVGDMRRQGLENEPVEQMFEPLAQNPSRLATLLVRTSTDPQDMAGTVQAAVRRVDRQAALYGVSTLTGRLEASQAERRFQTSLLASFSLVALVLAAVGIYGVVQYSIAMRTREIGVRMAVGAQRGDISRMIVGEGLKLSLAGLVPGLAGAVWLGHMASSLLFGVTATDVPTYAVVSLLLTTVAAAACYVPARRAARLDPLVALRYE